MFIKKHIIAALGVSKRIYMKKLVIPIMLTVITGCISTLPYNVETSQISHNNTAHAIKNRLEVRSFEYKPTDGINQNQYSLKGCLFCGTGSPSLPFSMLNIDEIVKTEVDKAVKEFSLQDDYSKQCSLSGIIYEVSQSIHDGDFTSDISYVVKKDSSTIFKKRIKYEANDRSMFDTRPFEQIFADVIHGNVKQLYSVSTFKDTISKNCS
jgi:hypothetical protein